MSVVRSSGIQMAPRCGSTGSTAHARYAHISVGLVDDAQLLLNRRELKYLRRPYVR